METLFRRLSWRRAIRNFRRRRPTSPIRRKPLELVRLDDRVAPGSILSAAAAQAVGLGGPLAWAGLTDFDADAASGIVGTRGMEAAPFSWAADDSWAAVADTPSDPCFSRTSADDATASTADPRYVLADAGTPVADVPGSLLSLNADDLAPPAALRSAQPIPLANSAAPSGSGGAPIADAPAVGRFSGVAVSGGLPAAPPADTTGPISPAPHPGGGTGGGRGSGTATVTHTAVAGTAALAAAAPTPLAKPAGHFAAQLQALLHTGDTSGTFNLSDTANRQTQIGSLIGGQLFGAVGMANGLGMSTVGDPAASATGGFSASHRPASLLGQALNAGSDQSLGLRTSPASSGPFGLVGSQSIGDLVSRHGPQGGGLLGGADAIDRAIPSASTLPNLGGRAAPAGPDPAAGLPGAVLTPISPAKGGKGSKAAQARNDPVVTPGTFTVTFSLTEQWEDADGDPTLTEQGTIAFLGLPGGGYETNGPDFVRAQISALANYGATNLWNLQWDGYADPGGLLYGTDFDQFNQRAFPDAPDPSTATSYVFDCVGDVPLSSTDTSTPSEQNGNTTTQHNYNNTATGDENVTVDEVGAGSSRQVTVNDTTTSNFHDRDTGAADDPVTADDPAYNHDTFTDTADGTATETDQYLGTIGPDGAFQLTSFSVDLTDDYNFTDSVTGTEGQPEPGGSESDTFTDSDTGHDHEQLHAEGSPDDWTASLDDNSNDGFGDGDTGGENSSQSANGETDTNHDTFHANDNGADTDQLHLEGHGTGSAFTVTTLSDTIEDIYNFDDGDGGDSGATTADEQDGDHYTNTDNGHADEKLTVSGDENNLTAVYGDTVDNGYGDSDAITANWDDPAALDSGSDTSTQGDGGNETVKLSAQASLPDWQADPTTTPASTWEITSVGADVTGSGTVQAGDDGTDNTVAASNSQDSDHDHYVDTSTGTDSFRYVLTGDGATAALTETATRALTTHAHDINSSQWDDPEQLDGQDGTDAGSDTTDATGDDTGSVTVSQTKAIDAAGHVSATNPTVDMTDTGTVNDAEIGTDDASAEPDGAQSAGDAGGAVTARGIDDRENVSDSAQLGEKLELHTRPIAAGGTSVDIDQQLTNGTISLGGGENDSNTESPGDTDTDVGSGTLAGPVTGDIHLTGIVDAAGAHVAPPNGFLRANLTGTASDTNTEHYIGNVPDRYVPGTPGNGFRVNSLLYAPPQVAFVAIGPNDLTGSTDVTVTTTVQVPNVHADDAVDDTNGAWTLDHLDSSAQLTTTVGYGGRYASVLGWPGNGSGKITDSVTEQVDDNTGDATGSETTSHTETVLADSSYAAGDNGAGGPVDTGSAHLDGTTKWSETATDLGDDETHEARHEEGTGHYTFHLDAPSVGVRNDLQTTATRLYDETGLDTVFGNTLLTASGTDGLTAHFEHVRTTPDTIDDTTEDYSTSITYKPGANDQVDDSYTATDTFSRMITDRATGQTHPYDPGAPTGPQTSGWDTLIGWAAKVADFAQEVNAAVDSGAIAAAKWVGSTAYAIADKAAQPFLMAADLAQCGYVGVYGAITGEYFEPHWLSDLAKNAPTDPNDKEAWNRYLAQAELDNLKDGAIAIATLGASKVAGPVVNKVVCKVTKNGCFAAGLPVPIEHGCKAIEDIRKGDVVWMRPEHDPTAPPVLGRVAATFKTHAPLWELSVGGRKLRMTGDHTFWVRGKGWTAVMDLRPGQELRTEDGWMQCDGSVDTDMSADVYNFEVAEGHTYFVGDAVTWGFALWNHNGIACAEAAAKAARAEAKAAHQAKGGTYLLRDPATRDVMRTGWTGNLVQRRSQHARDSLLRDYEFEVVHRTDVYAQQRGLEQVLHDTYKPPLDRINAISPFNPKRAEYLDAAEEFMQRLLEEG
jgi:hypothetical protein